MPEIKNDSISIYDALENIKSGKYVMPAFQRQYVWSMGQIEKLWDSILLDYPLATFLFWHLDDDNTGWDTNFCNFLQEATFDSRKNPATKNYDLSGINIKITDTAVLDGQQRLTSLFLSLIGDTYIKEKGARKSRGSIVSKLLIELNKNRLTIDEEEYNGKKFDVKFSEKIGKISPTQFEIKKITNEKFKNKDTRGKAIEEAIINVPLDSKDYAKDILTKLCGKVYDEKLIHYTEIKNMKQDDALEMFVRFNSGGKALSKSEITMSILEAYWPGSKTKFGEIFKDSYAEFNTDFIIRTALMLYGDVVKSNINNKIAQELKNNWEEFKKALKNLDCLLKDMGIDTKRFKNSWNVLLPIIYCIYYNPFYMDDKSAIKIYLVRAILFTYFQSGTTAKLQRLKSSINEYDGKITVEMLDQITDLQVTDGKTDDILDSEKGSKVASEALYFLSNAWLKNCKYEQDHLHPFSRFDKSKPINMEMGNWYLARRNRNRLANLYLLEGRSNGEKNDMSLEDYCSDMNDEQRKTFYEQAFIPQNIPLAIEYFNEFYNARRKLLKEKLKELLTLKNN